MQKYYAGGQNCCIFTKYSSGTCCLTKCSTNHGETISVCQHALHRSTSDRSVREQLLKKALGAACWSSWCSPWLCRNCWRLHRQNKQINQILHVKAIVLVLHCCYKAAGCLIIKNDTAHSHKQPGPSSQGHCVRGPYPCRVQCYSTWLMQWMEQYSV